MPNEIQEVTLEERIADATARMGEDGDRLKVVHYQLDAIRRAGMLVDISVKGTSILTRSVSWAELGIQGDGDDQDPRKRLMKTGKKYVIAPELADKIHSLENRARLALLKQSLPITGFAPYRFVPWRAYERWVENWAKILQEVEETKAAIIAGLEADRAEMRAEFTQIAEKAWQSITGQEYQYYITGGKVYDHDDFIEMVASAAVNQVPTEQAVSEIRFDYVPALVFGAADVAEDQARAAAIRENLELARKEQAEQRQVEYLQSSILMEQARHEAKQHQLEEMEREIKIEAYRQAEIEHMRKILEQERSPYEQAIQFCRDQAAESAKKMLSCIQKNGFIKGKVAENGRGLLEWFEIISIRDDQELKTRLEALKAAIGPDIKDRVAAAPRNNGRSRISCMKSWNYPPMPGSRYLKSTALAW